jgi:hypothetical protein
MKTCGIDYIYIQESYIMKLKLQQDEKENEQRIARRSIIESGVDAGEQIMIWRKDHRTYIYILQRGKLI